MWWLNKSSKFWSHSWDMTRWDELKKKVDSPIQNICDSLIQNFWILFSIMTRLLFYCNSISSYKYSGAFQEWWRPDVYSPLIHRTPLTPSLNRPPASWEHLWQVTSELTNWWPGKKKKLKRRNARTSRVAGDVGEQIERGGEGDADGDPEGEFFLFVCQPDDVKMEIQKVSFFSLTLSVNQMMWGRLGKLLWKMMDSAAINFSRRLINSSHTLATQKTHMNPSRKWFS